MFVPEGQNNNIPSLAQIIAWHRPGAKPLSEPIMVSLLTHICVSGPQWVKGLRFVGNNRVLYILTITYSGLLKCLPFCRHFLRWQLYVYLKLVHYDQLISWAATWYTGTCQQLRSYLTGRKQYTSINGVNSDSCELTCGVPQGSALGPLFFILYMNDIVNAADANNIRLYADDTGIFLHGRNLSNLINRTREYFRKLQKWFMCNRLTLNATKSYFSIYHTVNKPIPEGLDEIVIGNMKIQRSRTMKYI